MQLFSDDNRQTHLLSLLKSGVVAKGGVVTRGGITNSNYMWHDIALDKNTWKEVSEAERDDMFRYLSINYL